MQFLITVAVVLLVLGTIALEVFRTEFRVTAGQLFFVRLIILLGFFLWLSLQTPTSAP